MNGCHMVLLSSVLFHFWRCFDSRTHMNYISIFIIFDALSDEALSQHTFDSHKRWIKKLRYFSIRIPIFCHPWIFERKRSLFPASSSKSMIIHLESSQWHVGDYWSQSNEHFNVSRLPRYIVLYHYVFPNKFYIQLINVSILITIILITLVCNHRLCK